MVSVRSRGSGRKTDPKKADPVGQEVDKKVESVGRPRRDVKKTEKAKLLEDEKVEKAAKKVENCSTPRKAVKKVQDDQGSAKNKSVGSAKTHSVRSKTPLAVDDVTRDAPKSNVTTSRGRRHAKQREPLDLDHETPDAGGPPAPQAAGERVSSSKSRGRKKAEVAGSEPGPKPSPTSASVAKRNVRRAVRSETPKTRKDTFGVFLTGSKNAEPRVEPGPSVSAVSDSSLKNVSSRRGRPAKKVSTETPTSKSAAAAVVVVEEVKPKRAASSSKKGSALEAPKTSEAEKEPASIPKRGRAQKKKNSTPAGSNPSHSKSELSYES